MRSVFSHKAGCETYTPRCIYVWSEGEGIFKQPFGQLDVGESSKVILKSFRQLHGQVPPRMRKVGARLFQLGNLIENLVRCQSPAPLLAGHVARRGRRQGPPCSKAWQGGRKGPRLLSPAACGGAQGPAATTRQSVRQGFRKARLQRLRATSRIR